MHIPGYAHKGNYKMPYNLGTVPYVLGSLARAWYLSNGPKPI